jgi:putative ABC transport system permease protein
MNDFLLIRRNLFRNRLRAMLMLVVIAIAFAIFGVLAAFERAFEVGQNSSEDDRLVVVNKINFTRPLPVAYYDDVRRIKGVREASYAIWFGGYYQDPKNSLVVVVVEPQTYLRVVDTDFDFTQKMREAFLRDRTAALVGQAMAQKWGWKVGDRIPIASSFHTQKNGSRTWDLTIVGIFDKRKPYIGTNRMVFRYDYFNETRAFGKDMIGWLFLRVRSRADAERVAKAIDKEFANSPYETTTETEKAFNKAFATQFGNIALVVQLIVGAAFAIILLIVGSTMATAVHERSREIALLKTLGFSKGRVLRLVLGETLLLAFIGGVPGLLIASLVLISEQDSLVGFMPGMSLDPSVFVLGLALMACLGLATGIVPALGAFRLKPAKALSS